LPGDLDNETGPGELTENGRKPLVLLDGEPLLGKLHFLYGDHATIRARCGYAGFRAAQREAAFFYGLFCAAIPPSNFAGILKCLPLCC